MLAHQMMFQKHMRKCLSPISSLIHTQYKQVYSLRQGISSRQTVGKNRDLASGLNDLIGLQYRRGSETCQGMDQRIQLSTAIAQPEETQSLNNNGSQAAFAPRKKIRQIKVKSPFQAIFHCEFLNQQSDLSSQNSMLTYSGQNPKMMAKHYLDWEEGPSSSFTS